MYLHFYKKKYQYVFVTRNNFACYATRLYATFVCVACPSSGRNCKMPLRFQYLNFMFFCYFCFRCSCYMFSCSVAGNKQQSALQRTHHCRVYHVAFASFSEFTISLQPHDAAQNSAASIGNNILIHFVVMCGTTLAVVNGRSLR